VYINKETHDLLRRLKRAQRRSMARIVCDLVYREYEREVGCLNEKQSLKEMVKGLSGKHL